MIGDVEVGEVGSKGRGVYARRAFDEGEFIFRRRHTRTFPAAELDRATEWERIHLCELGFDRFAVLAPPGCYLNHACDPNAMRHGVKVVAWRPIERREEITIDYRLNAFDGSSWRAIAAPRTARAPSSAASSQWIRAAKSCSSPTLLPTSVANTTVADEAERRLPPAAGQRCVIPHRRPYRNHGRT